MWRGGGALGGDWHGRRFASNRRRWAVQPSAGVGECTGGWGGGGQWARMSVSTAKEGGISFKTVLGPAVQSNGLGLDVPNRDPAGGACGATG